ncbi:hypothetical protein GCM10010991_06100 [Gemmobacter aquaticus]|uniref:Uncharacterized protein n=1 Tax=Gemmobacter aquaticus TaxID=490185 RepID=A0A917YIA3_9RHOB|nr:hypothetical protein GCM10010991_06100 [Gemmobacter aquaticus]
MPKGAALFFSGKVERGLSAPSCLRQFIPEDIWEKKKGQARRLYWTWGLECRDLAAPEEVPGRCREYVGKGGGGQRPCAGLAGLGR